MSIIIIEKYVDGNRVEVLQFPAAPLRFLARLLPVKIRSGLLRRGLDIDTLLNGSTPSFTPQWMEIEEKKVAKRIRISRRD
ncbi:MULTISPECIES: hypothetical protein [unclassified Rhizobium]|uniref:hypothetical protein n=1 Tax=unclassified Rhizobium TaxID=2613769 RepID=UPI002479911C|nr:MULTISPECIES: hypothetical protein [unclassified Rhizobium]MDH7804799.1 hypothetical protein [Rhizobium sp. AN70]